MCTGTMYGMHIFFPGEEAPRFCMYIENQYLADISLCRQQSPSPAPSGAAAPALAGASQELSPAPTPPTKSRRQRSRSNQGLHRQVVSSQAQPQLVAKSQQSSSAAQHIGLPKSKSQSKKLADGNSNAEGNTGSAVQRTDSGRMLNPFASTFIPRTTSDSLLGSSVTSSQ